MKATRPRPCSRADVSAQRGSLLLEWLLAFTAGIFIVLLLIKLYQLLMTNTLVQNAHSDALHALASAERTLDHTLHLQTATPCGSTPHMLNLVRTHPRFAWLRGRPEVQIFAHDSPEAAALRPVGTSPGMRVAGSDVLVAFSTHPPLRVDYHDEPNRHFVLSETTPQESGSFALVCNDAVSVLFQVSQVRRRGRVVSYAQDDIFPGNCIDVFSLHRACHTRKPYTFATGAYLTWVQPRIFYASHARSAGQHNLVGERLFLVNRAAGTIEARMVQQSLVQGIALFRARRLSDHLVGIGLVAQASLPESLNPYPAQSEFFLLGDNVSAWLESRQNLFLIGEFHFAQLAS